MKKTLVVTCSAPASVRTAVEEGVAGYADIFYLDDAVPEK